MINIKDKKDCCACGSCAQTCPHKCISMTEDTEGFLYPLIDTTKCVDCGLCNKVCPVINRYEAPKEKPASFAAKSTDDRLIDKSSSGGFFTVLAEYIIRKGGIVFGAKFDADWNVIYDYTETIEGLQAFRGSKYVQGIVGNAFSQAKQFLKQGRLVLFTGTPCHIAGLNHFLQKEYDNLITVDFVCHSIPSPKVWRDYLKAVGNSKQISYVTFRDKSFGWDNYGLRIEGEYGKVLTKGGHKENVYMKAFSQNLTVRPSCFACPARNYTSGSDIMIADCWGLNKYHPEVDNNKGMSLVLPKTIKGMNAYEEIQGNLFFMQIPYNEVEEETNHKPIIKSAIPNPYRNVFFKHYSSNRLVADLEKYIKKDEQRRKHINLMKSIIRTIVGGRLINVIRHIHG